MCVCVFSFLFPSPLVTEEGGTLGSAVAIKHASQGQPGVRPSGDVAQNVGVFLILTAPLRCACVATGFVGDARLPRGPEMPLGEDEDRGRILLLWAPQLCWPEPCSCRCQRCLEDEKQQQTLSRDLHVSFSLPVPASSQPRGQRWKMEMTEDSFHNQKK